MPTYTKSILSMQIVLMFLWITQLFYTDAFYINYVLLLIISSICCYKNMSSGEFRQLEGKGNYLSILTNIFAFIFSCMVTFSNYSIWAFPNIPKEFGNLFGCCYKLILLEIFLIGGYFVFWNILGFLVLNITKINWKQNVNGLLNAKRVFWCSFIILVFARLIVLYLCYYPGIMSPDSIDQVHQIISGSYSNHHPYYHTQVIKMFMTLGMNLFNDINAAVATYSLFQILFTAMCFSFVADTLAKIKVPKWIIISTMLFYIMMPYHILYSITMWKDILFGCCVLLFVTFIYRFMSCIGNRFLNYFMLILSAFGICLFRSNGFFVFVILTLFFALIWRLRYKIILFIFGFVILISFVMTHSLLTKLDVKQADIVESLSIPVQQISRVIKEGGSLNVTERIMLNSVVDVKEVPNRYLPYISDPIKGLIRERGNQQFISDHKWDYIKLYFSIGIRHPVIYTLAWIDETKGYWNSGYRYWYWSSGIVGNNYGIGRNVKSEFLNKLLDQYLWLFITVQGLCMFISIGLFTWIDILMFFISLVRKDKLGVFVSLPILAIVVSLLIASPVFAEFRYMYAAFCALPMVIVIALRPINNEKSEKLNG